MTRAEKMRQRAAELLAEADVVERKELARQGQMVLYADLERAFTSSTGLSAATIAWTNRMLREGGVLPRRARGRAAESISISEAAIHVIGLLAFEKGRTTAETTAALLNSDIGREVGIRPHVRLEGLSNLGDIVTAILVFSVGTDANIKIGINRTDLSAKVSVEVGGRRWTAFFPPRREATGDYREIATFTDETVRTLAALYTGGQS